LGFPTFEGAKRYVQKTHEILDDDIGWEHVDMNTWRAEDEIGNWGLIRKVRISNPGGLFEYE
jgi:hypothetical protein